MKTKSRLFQNALCFFAGIAFTLAFIGLKKMSQIFFFGDEIACQSSFPRYHKACVYSRFGFGEQAITFRIDGKTVYHVEDFPGGDLGERISWSLEGRKVTFHINGLSDRIYDVE